MAHVDFENIDKIYPDGTQAICDFSLTIADGERVALVGPSGCGKSTLLRLLAGLETPTNGLLSIGGEAVNHQSPQQRNVAMVFQDYALYPHMTVRRNLEFPLKMRDLPCVEIERQVHWVTELLSLGGLLDRLPRQLSGGQRQRVAMGRALVRQPSVFLMDEPLSNLDAKLRVSARAEISRLHNRLETTFIYVTHDQVEAMTMGDRIAVMYDGILQQVDSPRNLYDSPANVFVAGFIGTPSMNFFDATLVSEEGKLIVDTGDFRVAVPDDRKKAYSSYVGKQVTFGIRPEHIHATEFAPPGIVPSPIKGTAEVVELLGHELHVYLRTGKHVPIATIDTRKRLSVGNEIDLVVDMANMHIFDKNTELAIR